MASSAIRTILPLAIVTSTSMLAMDLYLPAVPQLQHSMHTGVTLAQATIAVFLLGLALSQLLWAEVLTRNGPRSTVQWGMVLLVVASAACALSPTIELLLSVRLLQGIAAGAATVAAPTVIRATLSDVDAVRGLAAVGMVESIVPAAGPLLGAALLFHMDWRGLFWGLAGISALVLPFAVRATPRELPGLDRTVTAGYAAILRQREYRRVGLSQALTIGALLTFVASAPQLLVHALKLEVSAFATLQLMSVAVFMLVASQSGRVSQRWGAPAAIRAGAWVQLVLCIALLVASFTLRPQFWWLALFWCGFCGALAIRGPAAMSEALRLPPAQMGRASAMLVLGMLLAGALGTQLVAPFLSQRSPAALALCMLVFCGVSLVAVVPFPVQRKQA